MVATTPRLSVIIPAFNEEKTIGTVLKKVLKRDEVLEVIAVDDGSTDNTFRIVSKLKSARIRVFRHKKNLGKGAAIITGLKWARGEYVIIQDADLEYDPDDYPKLLAPIVSKKADFVIGTRWQNKYGYWYTLFANWLMTQLTESLFGVNFGDAYSGYKIGKRQVWQSLNLSSSGFEVEAEIVARLALIGARVVQVPINYKPRLYSEGKKIRASDAFRGIIKLMQIKFSSFKRSHFFRTPKFVILFFSLLFISYYFLLTRQMILPDKSVAVQYHWLDSVNTYLKTGKLLIVEDIDRVDDTNADKNLVYISNNVRYVPLEEVAGGDDQGYAAFLSLVAKVQRLHQITYELFIKFNYFLLIILGVLTSTLLFLSFRSVFLSTVFYIFYLYVVRTYEGYVYHHWLLGAYVPFYVSFIVFFLMRKRKFKPIFWTLYLLIAGLAEVIRTGDGMVGIALFSAVWIIVLAHNKFRIRVKNFLGKAIFVLVLVVVYTLPILTLSGVRTWRDNKYFDGRHSNLPARHLLWHHAFIGLGFTSNPYGIKFDENAHAKFLKQIAPSVRLYSVEEDKLLRNLYVDYVLNSPAFWFKNLWQKILVLHRLPEIWLGNKIFGLLNYSLYICLALIFLVSKRDRTKISIFWLLLAALFITSLPALFVVPRFYYLKGYIAAYFMTFFYLFILVWRKVTERKL